MDIEHFRNQAHAVWLEEYRTYARSVLKEGFGEGSYDAVILSPDLEADLTNLAQQNVSSQNSEELILPEPTYKARACIKMPVGSVQVFIALARHSHIMIDFPIVVNDYEFKHLPIYSFALSPLLQSAFPKEVRNGKFKNTTGGLLVGILGDIKSGDVGLHGALAGLGIILMDECRKVLSPFATDEDLIELTSEMFLSFLVSEIRMDGNG